MSDQQREVMTHEERTMREERWILSTELLDPERKEPDEVIAFRLLQEEDWMHFIDNIEGNDALKFFNTEQREFSSAADWKQLGEMEGVEPFDNRFEIHPKMAEGAQDFCREFRTALRTYGLEESLPENRLFFAPWEWRWPVDEETACVLRCPKDIIEDLPVSILEMGKPRRLWPRHLEDNIWLIGP